MKADEMAVSTAVSMAEMMAPLMVYWTAAMKVVMSVAYWELQLE